MARSAKIARDIVMLNLAGERDAAVKDRSAARAEVERLTRDGDDQRSALVEMRSILENTANVLQGKPGSWGWSDLATRVALLLTDLRASRAEVNAANDALVEAGEPRDDGVDALSLASRIRNLAADRDDGDRHHDNAAADMNARMMADIETIARLTAERDEAREGERKADAAGVSLMETYNRILAERDAAVAERDALRARVEAGLRECKGHQSFNVTDARSAATAIRAALEGSNG